MDTGANASLMPESFLDWEIADQRGGKQGDYRTHLLR